jgi:hypothetical protein
MDIIIDPYKHNGIPIGTTDLAYEIPVGIEGFWRRIGKTDSYKFL